MGLISEFPTPNKKKKEKELEEGEVEDDPENPYGDEDDQDILEKLLKAKKKRGKASMVEVND